MLNPIEALEKNKNFLLQSEYVHRENRRICLEFVPTYLYTYCECSLDRIEHSIMRCSSCLISIHY